MPETRKIILIDEERCDGCGQCVTACEEGALEIVDGKARVVRESYCDGLGACIGECPQDALTIEEREADPFDEQAAQRHLGELARRERQKIAPAQGCPAAALRTFETGATPTDTSGQDPSSRLGHWPVQLKLVPPDAPFLKDADLLVCADCVPFAVPDFHERYLAGRAVVVGCPKLDDIAYYRDKLLDLFARARPARVTVLRMEVPCCGALAQAVLDAHARVCPDMPVEVHTIGVRGGVRCEDGPPARAPCEGVSP